MGTYGFAEGKITLSPESVKVRRLLLGFPQTKTYNAEDIAFITVGGLDKQYATAGRAAGVVLTGGVALLAPSRKRSSIILALRDGTVLEFKLKGGQAKKTDLIRADAAACGYATQPVTA